MENCCRRRGASARIGPTGPEEEPAPFARPFPSLQGADLLGRANPPVRWNNNDKSNEKRTAAARKLMMKMELCCRRLFSLLERRQRTSLQLSATFLHASHTRKVWHSKFVSTMLLLPPHQGRANLCPFFHTRQGCIRTPTEAGKILCHPRISLTFLLAKQMFLPANCFSFGEIFTSEIET